MQLANLVKYAGETGGINIPINDDVRQSRIIYFNKVIDDVLHLKAAECIVRLPFKNCLMSFENQLCVYAREFCGEGIKGLNRETFLISFLMFSHIKGGFYLHPVEFVHIVNKEGLIQGDWGGTKGNLFLRPAYDDEVVDQEDMKNVLEIAKLCTTHLTLLNCKNVSLERREQASDKINQRRIRNNRLPFYSYYVASIGKNSVYFKSSGVKTCDHYRFHICRGHFKRRRTGTFWWNHHARGQKDLGVIVKDYKIETLSGKDITSCVSEV